MGISGIRNSFCEKKTKLKHSKLPAKSQIGKSPSVNVRLMGRFVLPDIITLVKYKLIKVK